MRVTVFELSKHFFFLQRRMWKKHEDEKLKVGVERYGPNAWKRVSASIMNHRRSPLSCKERYKILMEPKVMNDDNTYLLTRLDMCTDIEN